MNQNITIINGLELPCHYTKMCLPIYENDGTFKYYKLLPGAVLKSIPNAHKINEHDFKKWLETDILRPLDSDNDLVQPTLHFLMGYMSVEGGHLGTYNGKFALQTGYSVDLTRSVYYGSFINSKNLENVSKNFQQLMSGDTSQELTDLNQMIWDDMIDRRRDLKDLNWAFKPGIYILTGEVDIVEPLGPATYHPTEVECGEELSKRIIESCFNLGKQVVKTARNLTCN